MFENDYILKQIEMSTKFLAKLIFGKESPEYKLQYDEIANAKPIDLLCLTLRRMIDEGEINEAENLLYENIEREARAEYLEIAIDFYDRLSKLSADRLVRHQKLAHLRNVALKSHDFLVDIHFIRKESHFV